MYCVIGMAIFAGRTNYFHCVTHPGLNDAILAADQLNKTHSYQGRYFVVSRKEYEDLWRK